MQMSGRKRKKKNVKGRKEEGHVTLISVLVPNNYGGRKSIVLLKDSKTPIFKMASSKNVLPQIP